MGNTAVTHAVKSLLSGSPPHAWGILSRLVPFIERPCGSPPHAWGIQAVAIRDETNDRFTPTRVGNTDDGRQIVLTHSVHPHTRGEYSFILSARASISGSPPHAWGIRIAPRHYVLRVRFTPTRVGNTSSWIARPIWTTVHPHTRGEYALALKMKEYSPRVWG